MERFPSELVTLVFRKLAVQDPLSLLRATCACKSWLHLVNNNEGIWKASFLAPVPGGTLASEQNAITSEHHKSMAELDSEVASLGGYAQLALVRFRHRKPKEPGWFEFEQTRFESRRRVGDCFSRARSWVFGEYEDVVARYLYIYRLKGRIFGWTASSPAQGLILEHVRTLLPRRTLLKPARSIRVHFRFVPGGTPATRRRKGITDQRPLVERWAKSRALIDTLPGRRSADDGDITTETYAFLKPIIRASGRVSSLEGKPWTWVLDASLSDEVGYEPPKCEGRVFIISQESRNRCGFLEKTAVVVDGAETSQRLEWAVTILALVSVLVGVVWAALM